MNIYFTFSVLIPLCYSLSVVAGRVEQGSGSRARAPTRESFVLPKKSLDYLLDVPDLREKVYKKAFEATERRQNVDITALLSNEDYVKNLLIQIYQEEKQNEQVKLPHSKSKSSSPARSQSQLRRSSSGNKHPKL